MFVTGGSDKTVRLWNAVEHRVVWTNNKLFRAPDRVNKTLCNAFLGHVSQQMLSTNVTDWTNSNCIPVAQSPPTQFIGELYFISEVEYESPRNDGVGGYAVACILQ